MHSDNTQPSDASRRSRVLKELGDCYASVNDADKARQCYEQAADSAPEEGAPYVGLGALAVQQGDLDAAERAFRVAARRAPDCPEAFGGLAMVFHQRSQYANAFEMYLKCLELDSDNLFALLGLFQTSCQMGTFCKIIEFLELYLSRHPDDASVLFCLATLYAREGKLEQARLAVVRVLASDPMKADAHALLQQVESRMTCLGLEQTIQS